MNKEDPNAPQSTTTFPPSPTAIANFKPIVLIPPSSLTLAPTPFSSAHWCWRKSTHVLHPVPDYCTRSSAMS